MIVVRHLYVQEITDHRPRSRGTAIIFFPFPFLGRRLAFSFVLHSCSTEANATYKTPPSPSASLSSGRKFSLDFPSIPRLEFSLLSFQFLCSCEFLISVSGYKTVPHAGRENGSARSLACFFSFVRLGLGLTRSGWGFTLWLSEANS